MAGVSFFAAVFVAALVLLLAAGAVDAFEEAEGSVALAFFSSAVFFGALVVEDFLTAVLGAAAFFCAESGFGFMAGFAGEPWLLLAVFSFDSFSVFGSVFFAFAMLRNPRVRSGDANKGRCCGAVIMTVNRRTRGWSQLVRCRFPNAAGSLLHRSPARHQICRQLAGGETSEPRFALRTNDLFLR